MYTHSKQLTENLHDLVNKMKLTKSQLRRIIKEEKSKIMSETSYANRERYEVLRQVRGKIEYELLVDIQNDILNMLPPAMRRTVDLGAGAELMGFDDLMEQVQEWFENYVSAMTDLDGDK